MRLRPKPGIDKTGLESTQHLTVVTEALQAIITAIGKKPWLTEKIDSRTRVAAGRLLHQVTHFRAGLIVGLVGGTGVGKSSIINALAGEEISRSSSLRPYTGTIVVYKHRDSSVPEVLLGDELSTVVVPHAIDSLRRIFLLDLPDFDSYDSRHHETVSRIIKYLDLVLWVVDADKYGDRIFYELLVKEINFRKNFIFIFNKIDRYWPDLEKYAGEELLARVERDFHAKLQSVGIGSPEVYFISAQDALAPQAARRASDQRNQFKEFKQFLWTTLDRKLYDFIKGQNLLKAYDTLLSQVEHTQLMSFLEQEIASFRTILAQESKNFEVWWRQEAQTALWRQLQATGLTGEVLVAGAQRLSGVIGLINEALNWLVMRFGGKGKILGNSSSGEESELFLDGFNAAAASDLVKLSRDQDLVDEFDHAMSALNLEIAAGIKTATKSLQDWTHSKKFLRHWRFSQHLGPVLLIAVTVMIFYADYAYRFQYQVSLPFVAGLIAAVYVLEAFLVRRGLTARVQGIWRAMINRLDDRAAAMWRQTIADSIDDTVALLELLIAKFALLADYRRRLEDIISAPQKKE